MKSASLLSLFLLGIVSLQPAQAQQFVLPTIPKKTDLLPEPQLTPQPAQKPKEQPRPDEIIETSPHPRQTWTNVPDSLFYSDGLYTPYDKAIYEALVRNERKSILGKLSPTTNNISFTGAPYDSIFTELKMAHSKRTKLSDADQPLMGLTKLTPFPEGSRVRYKDGKLEIAAPEQCLAAIDKQLKYKSYQVSDIFNKIDFPGAVPRTDALLYLFVHLSEESTRILQTAGQKNKSGKNYTRRVTELITAASKNEDIEVIITVDPQLDKKRVRQAFKYLRLISPDYAMATATTKKADANDYTQLQKEVPAELASLVFPNGLKLPVYDITSHIVRVDSETKVELYSDPSRLNNMLDAYLRNIKVYLKQYCTSDGPVSPDGTPLAKPETKQASPEPAAEPAPQPKKKKKARRKFKAI